MTEDRGKRNQDEGPAPDDALALFSSESESTAPPVPSSGEQPTFAKPVSQPGVQAVVQPLVPPAVPDDGPPAASTDHLPRWMSSSESESTAPPVPSSAEQSTLPPPVAEPEVQAVIQPIVPLAVPGGRLRSASTDRLPKWALTTAAGVAALALALALLTRSRPPAQSNEASALSPAPNAERLAVAPIPEPPPIPSASTGAATPTQADARTPGAAASAPPPAPAFSPRNGAVPPVDIAAPLQQPAPRNSGESPRVRRESRPDPPPSIAAQGELDSRPLTDFGIPAAVLSPALPKVEIAAATPVAPPDDYTRIQTVLDAYKGAYERLDVVAVAILWPGVDTRALSRAFSTLSRQGVLFDRCDINVTGTHATANCDGVIEYVRSVGDAAPQSRSTSWAFALDHSDGQWRIANIAAR